MISRRTSSGRASGPPLGETAGRQSEDQIEIRGIEVFAHHGVHPQERAQGQRFVIDVRVSMDLEKAASSDRLDDTVDYGELVRRIHEVVASERFNLIESVAARVADVGMADPRVEQIRVTVHKPQAPLSVEFSDVAVTLTRTRG